MNCTIKHEYQSTACKSLRRGLFLISLLVSVWAYGQCPPAGGGDFEGDLTITGNCTVNGDLVLKKKNVTIAPGGSLTVNGNFDNDGGGTITVNGTLIVTGDMNNNGNGQVTIDGGAVDIDGSFDNAGNGVVTVDNGGILDVAVDYTNGGNGTTNFLDGDINIGGDYLNEGNGNIAANGVVTIGGDFTVNGNGTNTIAGGLNIGGLATFGSKGVDIEDGGVLQANSIISEGPIDIEEGGTLFVPSGVIVGIVNNDPANGDQDCTNNCCGSQCNASGDGLNQQGKQTLPVDLTFFNSITDGEAVVLKWSTATEINNDYFQVERSFDGENFELAGYLDGNGNTQNQMDYEFRDYPTSDGLIFYRLTQVDFDGQFEIFPLINLMFATLITAPQAYPSVLNNNQNLTMDNVWGKINAIDLKFIDLAGSGIFSAPLMFQGNKITFPDISNHLQPGIYLLRGRVNDTDISQKIVVRN